MPESALREAVLNAVAHQDYASCTPIQISVYDDRILIWNSGTLPDNWTVERLKTKHPSQPFNPDIARTFFRAGMLEAWGRGIERMRADCAAHGAPDPTLRYEPGGMWVEFANRTVESEDGAQKTREETTLDVHVKAQFGTKSALSRHQVAILRKCFEECTLRDLLATTGRADRTKFRHQVMNPLLEIGLIEMTIPDKPRSSRQKYRITAKGSAALTAIPERLE